MLRLVGLQRELKDVLYAKLISSQPADSDADLLMLLHQHLEITQPASKADLKELVAEVQRLTERVGVLEQTCCSQAERSFRRHDDPDSEDRQEGEKEKDANINSQTRSGDRASPVEKVHPETSKEQPADAE